MTIAMMIYLINLAASLKTISLIIAWGGVIFAIMAAIMAPLLFMDFNKEASSIKDFLYKLRWLLTSVYVLSILLIIAIPDKQDMYIILGLSVAETVITSDKGNELFDKSYQLVVDKIDEAIADKDKQKRKDD